MNTKKLFLLGFLFFCISFSFAQTTKDKKKTTNSSSSNTQTKTSSQPASSGTTCFNESSKILNIGIGFGGGRYYRYGNLTGYSYRTSPAISLTYEQALKQKVGPGYLGVGVYFGYQTARFQYDNYYYNNNNYYYRHNWTYMLIAARAAYHLEDLMTENAELYFGGIIGIRYTKYSFETNSPDPNKNLYQLNERSIYPSYSLFVGGRYLFTKNIGAFAELGYGISWLTGGLTIKF